MESGKSLLTERTFCFALNIVLIYKQLANEKKEFILSKQLLRFGTSIGAMVREARSGESIRDFVHKLSVALKECNESIYWIELLKASHYLTEKEFQELHSNATIIAKMLAKSILSCKSNRVL